MRIDHGPGSYECVRFYNTQSPCNLYFAVGPKLFVYFPENNTCCTDHFAIGPLPPDWLENSTYEGITGCPPCNTKKQQCNHYTEKGDKGMHHYWELLSGNPCVFTFADVVPQFIIYDSQSFDISPQNPNLFTPPVKCSSKCSKTV